VLPAGLEERYRRLRRRPSERAALRADREAAVTRVAFATTEELFLPRLPLEPGRDGVPPRPVERPGEGDVLAGLDADGRPVFVRQAIGPDGEARKAVLDGPGRSDRSRVIGARLLTWSPGRVEVVGFLTSDGVSHVT